MIRYALPFASYQRINSIHFSSLKALDLSPRHYLRALAHGRADTQALRLGRLTHALALTPELPDGLAIWDTPRRGKTWNAFELEHVGQEIVRSEDLELGCAMRAAVMAHPIAGHLLTHGDPEVTIEWSTPVGLRGKCRVDWLRKDLTLVELKTTRRCGPREFMREFATRLYHAQAAFYIDGVSAALGLDYAPPLRVIAVEKEPPHDVCVYRVGLDVIDAGRRKMDAWLRTVADCTASGRWPGAGSDEEIDLILPDWALSDGLADVDLKGIGGDE